MLFGSLLAYTFYLSLVRDWGPSRAGAYSFVSPSIAVVLGIIVLDEQVSGMDVLGMGIMLAAAWLALQESGGEARAPRHGGVVLERGGSTWKSIEGA